MKFGNSKLLTALTLLSTALCATLTGQFQAANNLTSRDVQQTFINVVSVPSDGREPVKKTVYLKQDGSFEVTNLQQGTYLLCFTSIDYNLVPYKARVDVDENDELSVYSLMPGQSWEESQSLPIEVPIKVGASGNQPKRQYFKKRSSGILESGPLATIVNNPLYLGGAVFLISLAFAPKVLEYLDPDGVEEIRTSARDKKRAETEGEGSKAALEAAEKLQKLAEAKIGAASGSTTGTAAKKETKKNGKKRKN